jgi:hypothetical protein
VDQDVTAPQAAAGGNDPGVPPTLRADVWRQLLAERRSPSDPPPATIRGLYVGTIPPKSEGDPVLVTLRGADADGDGDAGDRITPPIVIPEPPPTRSRVRARSRRVRSVLLAAGAAVVALTALLASRHTAPQAEPPPLPPLADAHGAQASSPR